MLSGDDGNDWIEAGDGDDIAYGGDGNDTLLGGAGNDLLFTGGGDNSADGGDGDDAIVGEGGNDILSGNSGDDRIYGNAGRDVINGGAGVDLLSGGADGDVFVWSRLQHSLLGSPGAYRFDTVTDYRSGDRLDAVFDGATGSIQSSLAHIGQLSAAAIAGALTTRSFTSYAARAFTASGWNGTFVAFNDGNAGFDATQDSIIFLSNYNFATAATAIIVI